MRKCSLLCENARELNPPMRIPEIIIADDHPLLRSAVGHALRDLPQGAVIHEAWSFSTLERQIAERTEADLVLLDLGMPGAKGFSVLMFLRAVRATLPIVVISANDHPRTIRRAQQFGAAGFIPKSAPVATMRAAVQAVLDGESWFPAERAERNLDDARLAAQLAQLTPQQLRVLMCIAEGMLNKQIAHDLGLAENTVKVHITAILRKLGVNTRTKAALLVQVLDADHLPPGASFESEAHSETE
jgi:DNA-binding NarL/FixJ family response regulator